MQKISKKLSGEDFKNELIKFLKSPKRNTWIYLIIGRVYVRKSKRRLDLPVSHHKALEECFDIASIYIDEKYQNQGYFKQLLLALTEVNPYGYVYIECVHNQYLKEYLTRSNWMQTEKCNSFYLENELLQAQLILKK
jgi:GNAT superfamily N-acetyltransferase